ncbi:hypothetical protein CIRG_04390 [Coccidioides immitis RMSCC 2394]|uniref:Uncharacterized protein n=1 Tax=Coccidioides immitis RMSCC 2394 TaxID=404692 RepID=A0A0J6YCB8_COCIT|nr:hypothetical protein CIRG_04390 [Coccidioides immitis RMSCC 2394]
MLVLPDISDDGGSDWLWLQILLPLIGGSLTKAIDFGISVGSPWRACSLSRRRVAAGSKWALPGIFLDPHFPSPLPPFVFSSSLIPSHPISSPEAAVTRFTLSSLCR